MIRVGLALLLLLPGPVAGDVPDPAQANEVGKVLFAEGDFESARDLWADAFVAARGGDELALATNLGIACFRLERWADAFYYFAYARAFEDLSDLQIRKHRKVLKALESLRQKLTGSHGRLVVRTRPSPNAPVCVGEVEPVCRKAPADWYLPPGLHHVQVALPGAAPLSETVRIHKGKTTRLDLLLPVARAALDHRAVTAGEHHTCLVSRDGDLRCTGDNRKGQLGADRGDWYHRRPLSVVGIGLPVVAMAAGRGHTCAITDAGTVFCWGEGDRARLGDGAAGREASWRPVPVAGLPANATAIAAGRDHTCVLLDSGAVHCWGANDHGQLGTGGPSNPSSVALPVAGLDGDVVGLAAGWGFTCALIKGGAVRCWGRSPNGASAVATPLPDAPPVVTALAAGYRHLMLQVSDEVHVLRPKKGLRVEPSFGPIRQVAAAGDRTCALLKDGRIQCLRKRGSVTLNILESGDPKAVDLAIGPAHTCVVLEDGRFRCVGENAFGQLGR